MNASFLFDTGNSTNYNLVIFTLFLTIGIFTSLKVGVSASPVVGSAISTVTVTETITLPPVTVYLAPTSEPQPNLGDIISVVSESSYLVPAVSLAIATASAVYTYRWLYIYKVSIAPSFFFFSGAGAACLALLVNMISSNLAHLSTNALTYLLAQNFIFELIYSFIELHYLSLHINIYFYYALSLFYHFVESLPFLGYLGDDGLHITRWLVIISFYIKLCVLIFSLA
jgi:hypothetical protein